MASRRPKEWLGISAGIQREAREQGMAPCVPEDALALYDRFVTDAELRDVTRKLFADCHYAQAVEEAYKFLNNLVKSRSGIEDDGASLMRKAFSVNNPKLRLNRLRSRSEKDQQLGYMEILAGCMTGIRNPRAHSHKHADLREGAVEMLSWANHLVRNVRRATRTRRRTKSS